MKILHVLSDTNIGGAGMLLLHTLRHFDRSKFEIKVVLPRDAELIPRVEALGYEVIGTRYGADRSYEREATKELSEIIKKEKPDIVHTHSSLSARIAARKNHVPRVFQTHHCAVEPPKYKTVFPLKQLLGALNNYLSDRIIATASVAADLLIKQGTSRDKISVIINGAEPLREVSPEEKNALMEELGLSKENFIVTIVARLEPVKDHKTFIAAAAEASKTDPNMRFLIIGSGSLDESLRELTANLGISDKVIFTGFCRDTAPYMAISDVNVNCSQSETSCLALSEGMSAAVPVIASDCEGNTAMVRDGENGLIFERENSEMLATAMLTLAENKELRDRMGARAKEIFYEEYTASIMTKRLEELYISEMEG